MSVNEARTKKVQEVSIFDNMAAKGQKLALEDAANSLKDGWLPEFCGVARARLAALPANTGVNRRLRLAGDKKLADLAAATDLGHLGVYGLVAFLTQLAAGDAKAALEVYLRWHPSVGADPTADAATLRRASQDGRAAIKRIGARAAQVMIPTLLVAG